MHVEAVREHQRRAVLHVAVQVLAIDVGLQFVGREHHHHVGPFGGLGDLHHLELLALGLLDAAAKPLRSATATSFTPLSRRLSAWAWPWLP